jgi:hypothetical protein
MQQYLALEYNTKFHGDTAFGGRTVDGRGPLLPSAAAAPSGRASDAGNHRRATMDKVRSQEGKAAGNAATTSLA